MHYLIRLATWNWIHYLELLIGDMDYGSLLDSQIIVLVVHLGFHSRRPWYMNLLLVNRFFNFLIL